MPLYIWNGSQYVRVDDGAGNIQIKNVVYDANKDGVIDANKIADLSRSKITDFFNSPFWDNIPDKPSVFPPESHTHDDRYYTKSQLQTSGQAQVHWDNITNKPSTYPPSSHTHTRSDITDWAHEHNIKIGDGSATKITLQTNQDLHIVGSGNISISYDDTNNKITITVTEGSGSGLDADTVDGKHASEFALVNHTHAIGDLSDVSVASPSSGQVIKYNGTNWANENVDWSEITGKPSTFPPSSHTHTVSEITDIEGKYTKAENGGKHIWVQSSTPSAKAVGDIWIQT